MKNILLAILLVLALAVSVVVTGHRTLVLHAYATVSPADSGSGQ